MNNIDIIVSYHDFEITNFDVLKSRLLPVSKRIHLVNNNYRRGKYLNDFVKHIKPQTGIVFDEFNSQSFFYDNIPDDCEYVYHTHYRRSFNLPDELSLNKYKIYCVKGEIWSSEHFVETNNCKYYFKDINHLKNIRCEVLGYTGETDDYITYNTPFVSREIYIIHVDIFKEFIEKEYQYINLLYNRLDNSYFDIPRFFGYAIENFYSYFMNYKELKGFECEPCMIGYW